MSNRTKEQNKVYMTAWREKNHDKVRETARRYYQKKKLEPGWVAGCVAKNKAYRDANPEINSQRMRQYRNQKPNRYAAYEIRKNYKVSLTEAEKLLERKKHGCEVCGSKTKPSIDHDHETLKIRGILCNACNVAIGHTFESPATLRALADYLERHQ